MLEKNEKFVYFNSANFNSNEHLLIILLTFLFQITKCPDFIRTMKNLDTSCKHFYNYYNFYYFYFPTLLIIDKIYITILCV